MIQPTAKTSFAKQKVLETLELAKSDPDVAALVPNPLVNKAVLDNGSTLISTMETVFGSYPDRPALGGRSYQIEDGRRTYSASFNSLSYADFQKRIKAISSAWQNHPIHHVEPGDMVCIMGFASADFACLDYACAYTHSVTVPLQSATSGADLSEIFATIEPVTIAASIADLKVCAEHAIKNGAIRSLIVFDFEANDQEDQAQFSAAASILKESGVSTKLLTLDDLIAFGLTQDWKEPKIHADEGKRMAAIIHSSGSTGRPKGAVISEDAIRASWIADEKPLPMLTIISSPLNHILGRVSLMAALRVGGSAYFTLMPDMSSLLDDVRLVRPIYMVFFPRILEMIYQHYQNEVATRVRSGEGSEKEVDALVREEMRNNYLGGRLKIGAVGGAPTSKAVMNFMRDCFGVLLLNGYGNTESGSGTVTLNGKVQRPPVIDYKLRDVPELGYYSSDKPYPRGEFCYKSTVGIKEYYKQPEATAGLFDEDGFSRTGDVVEERGPDHIVVIDRVKDVLKLSQGEYVAVGTLGTKFEGGSAVIKQIYIYGNSLRSYLLAVLVPDVEAVTAALGKDYEQNQLKNLIRDELNRVAKEQELKSFEVPRDFIIEWEPFSQENGLLSSVRKRLRPALKIKYATQLEELYDKQEGKQEAEYEALKNADSGMTVIERLARLLEIELKIEGIDISKPRTFAELGGDSLSAVAFSLSIEHIFGIKIPADHILSPTANVQKWADFIQRSISGNDDRPSFASIHGEDATVVHSNDLALRKFIGSEALDHATNALPPSTETRSVLLTGANGFLGHIVCLDWLEKLAPVGGKLICLIRAENDHAAHQRLEKMFVGLDSKLETRFKALATDHLEVIAGDASEALLGLDDVAFSKLASEVDRICHVAALVNHRLSYEHLFGPNVVGTAEIIRLALTSRKKSIDFVSTEAVYSLLDTSEVQNEDSPLLEKIKLGDYYALGYGTSKWAGEHLLHKAHQDFALPVNIFRGDMMLAHQHFSGQMNIADMFTRLMFSIITTGLAPYSFYQLSEKGEKQLAHYDGIPVDIVSASVVGVADISNPKNQNYNISNYHHDDGCSLDSFVDCIESAGYPVTRINDHADWLARFKEKLNNLPEAQRQQTALEILSAFAKPLPVKNTQLGCANFKNLVENLAVGPSIPHLSETYIQKCLNDLVLLGLVDKPSA